MRKLILVAAILCGVSANAAKVDSATELENYRLELKTVSSARLYSYAADAIVRSTGNCSLSTVLTIGAFVTDTVPLTNPVAEWLGNSSNQRYSTYNTLWSWETLANTGRGAVGGAGIAAYEAAEALVKYAAGEEITWEQLSQVYASSFAVSDAVFGQESRCMVNLAKLTMVRVEWRIRAGAAPYTPMMQPR